jgi:hypothetical protein
MTLQEIKECVIKAGLDGTFHTGYKIDPIELSHRAATLCKFAQESELEITLPCESSKDARTKGTLYRRIRNLLLEQDWLQDTAIKASLLAVVFQSRQAKLILKKRVNAKTNPDVVVTSAVVEIAAQNTKLVDAFLVILHEQALPPSVQLRICAEGLSILGNKELTDSLNALARLNKIQLFLIENTFYIST